MLATGQGRVTHFLTGHSGKELTSGSGTQAELRLGSGDRRGARWDSGRKRPCQEAPPFLRFVPRFSPERAAFPQPAPFEPRRGTGSGGRGGLRSGSNLFWSLLFGKMEPVIQVLPIIFSERKGSVLSSGKAASL